MEIRKARLEELDQLMEIFDKARNFMRSTGNHKQWINGYPQRELVKSDIEKGVCYVSVEDNKITGTFALIEGEEPTYSVIEGGQWINDEPYGTIHRAASSGEKKGLFGEYVKWAFEKCGNLRADTHEDNKVMQHLLEKYGFEYCGIITVADGSPRKAYQKIK